MNIIFLDVDGVLNCISTTIKYNGITGVEPEKITFLKEIINFTNGKIVLISSWVQNNELYNYLSFQFSLKNLFIFDCIYNNTINRSDCILNWIKLHKPSFYIILDDCFSYYKNSHLKQNLIRISSNTGLNENYIKTAKSKFKERIKPMKTFYKKILETEFNGKTIFEQLVKNGLTVSKSYKGSEYGKDTSKPTIMFVGRAMNGWEDEKKYTSVDEFISALFSSDKNAFDTKNVFNDVVNPNGIPNIDNTKKYFYSRSKFWKLIHHILKEYGMANNNWYDNGNGENMNWSQKIVWSNLYKISPYSAGNPEDKLMKLNMNEYINILKAEIAEYKPQKLIFITDKWFIEPDENLPSFKKALEIKFIENPDTCIVGTGQFGGASIVVCTRPDKWGMTNAQIEKMAEEIKDALGK